MLLNKNIITIQHPESIHHTNGMIGSLTDWELTEKGAMQAENIACQIKEEFQDINYTIYTSPLKRTRQTAEILGKELNMTANLRDALKERSLGKAIGKSVQWLKENIENEEKTIFDKCFSDAESRFDVWNRLLPFYNEIMDSDNENIIIVSHGDTLSIFNIMWLGLDPEALNDIDLSGVSGGVSFLYRKTCGKRIIKRLSDTSYILPF
ncbi:phosphoglycerate mutase [Chryseobacterium formosense]|uniref:Phosphoglycerate mutase n=1 Tax=Chryseobacterium formosense TaxID=236814 RepID=A0A085YZE3_9FLAO|nr:histidine phosphatase family protein [Chryseobacterium formosense]KFE97556.1 phosphoglycerate mutase [Chryseobacterium formosense]SFT74909.1 probable phosphoglycerate mutase [Chryseobacterium formosense]